jgi:hypothetical protein
VLTKKDLLTEESIIFENNNNADQLFDTVFAGEDSQFLVSTYKKVASHELCLNIYDMQSKKHIFTEVCSNIFFSLNTTPDMWIQLKEMIYYFKLTLDPVSKVS